MVDPDLERKDAEIDEEMSVAVVFDEEEQESEEEAGFEVREESDEDEENEGAEREEGTPDDADAGGEEEMVIGGGSSSRTKAKGKSDKDIVSPHSIDGFWVQCQIAEVYPDPVTAADKTASVLSILGSESKLRDCENQLAAEARGFVFQRPPTQQILTFIERASPLSLTWFSFSNPQDGASLFSFVVSEKCLPHLQYSSRHVRDLLEARVGCSRPGNVGHVQDGRKANVRPVSINTVLMPSLQVEFDDSSTTIQGCTLRNPSEG